LQEMESSAKLCDVAAGLTQKQLDDLKTAKSTSEEKLLNATARIKNLKADISASEENLQKATARIKHLEEVTKHAQKQLEDLKMAKSASDKELKSLREDFKTAGAKHTEKAQETIEQIIDYFAKFPSDKELESVREDFKTAAAKHTEKSQKTIEQIIEDFTKEVTGLTKRPRKQARQDDLG
jgi:chromosome segregation ATPase